MRLITGILWTIATLLWLPWFTALVRFLVDLVMGVAPTESAFINPALVSLWPVRGWTAWGIVSWAPVAGIVGMLLTYTGWRFFWWADDWRVTYRTPAVVATVLAPPAALVLLYRDARARFRRMNSRLRAAADESLEELPQPDDLQLFTRS